jgi:hypothetical protein
MESHRDCTGHRSIFSTDDNEATLLEMVHQQRMTIVASMKRVYAGSSGGSLQCEFTEDQTMSTGGAGHSCHAWLATAWSKRENDEPCESVVGFCGGITTGMCTQEHCMSARTLSASAHNCSTERLWSQQLSADVSCSAWQQVQVVGPSSMQHKSPSPMQR